MSGLIDKNPQSFLLTGGGTGAPWNWGVSPFDQSSIDAATAQNTKAMTNRYNQLGLGGSTMEQQDLAGIKQAGTAMTGQEQTANVGQPALNPALQPQLNDLIGQLGQTQNIGSSLSSLAGLASGAGGLSNLLGGAGAAGAGAAAGGADIGTLLSAGILA